MKELATRFLKNVIPLERLSPYRARGAAIIAADRLVPPDRAWSLCSELEERVADAFSAVPHELPSYLRVSSRWGREARRKTTRNVRAGRSCRYCASLL